LKEHLWDDYFVYIKASHGLTKKLSQEYQIVHLIKHDNSNQTIYTPVFEKNETKTIKSEIIEKVAEIEDDKDDKEDR